MKQIDRFAFQLKQRQDHRQKPEDIQAWASVLREMDEDPALAELTRQMEREHQEHLAARPCLEPQRTVLFYSRWDWVCNPLTVPYFRGAIRRAARWLTERGFTTFVADYGTAFGLLAMETLLELRETGYPFSLYAARSTSMGRRQSWRLFREADWELIPLISKCDYHYSQLSPVQTLLELYSTADCFCTEIGVERRKRAGGDRP